jgi:hypothetical protein
MDTCADGLKAGLRMSTADALRMINNNTCAADSSQTANLRIRYHCDICWRQLGFREGLLDQAHNVLLVMDSRFLGQEACPWRSDVPGVQ